ncbi:MAG: glycosyltransferase family 4 protein [Deferrisomatales bacterium]
MKILLLSSLEHQSGSALRFRGIAGALARAGHRVHLLEPYPPGTEPETPPGVHRLGCPRLPGPPIPQAPLWLLAGLWALARVQPRVVYTLKALPNVWVPARLARAGGRTVVADLDDLDYGYYPPGWARAVVRHYFDRAIREADFVTVHNRTMARRVDAVRGPGRRALFVDQGIEVERFARARAPEGLARRLGLADGPVLLYAGHLGPASDLGHILPALAPVAERRPDARLLVVGDGECRASLEALARRSLPGGFCVFAGAVAHRDVPGYFALAHLSLNYLAPNHANRFRASIKTREALAAGVPVVASRTADNGRFAPFVRFPEDPSPEAFARAVWEELEHPHPERARAGAEHLRRHGGWDAAARELVALLARLEGGAERGRLRHRSG